jgi:DNA-binding MarR family transcriptional regulator
MHAVFNEMKRAYWRSHAMLAPVAKRHGLTPARYDMLFAIATSAGRVILSRDLRRACGTTPGVVSRMLRSLEELGLVRCDRKDRFKGSFFVEITEKGLARLIAAMSEVDAGGVELAMESVVVEDWMNPDLRVLDMKELGTWLRRVRVRRGDRGRLDYARPIAETLADPRKAHRKLPYLVDLRIAQARRTRRNLMERRRRARRAREEACASRARDPIAVEIARATAPAEPFPWLPVIEYRGKDNRLFRVLFADQIVWDAGPFSECDPMLEEEIEIPDGERPRFD